MGHGVNHVIFDRMCNSPFAGIAFCPHPLNSRRAQRNFEFREDRFQDGLDACGDMVAIHGEAMALRNFSDSAHVELPIGGIHNGLRRQKIARLVEDHAFGQRGNRRVILERVGNYWHASGDQCVEQTYRNVIEHGDDPM